MFPSSSAPLSERPATGGASSTSIPTQTDELGPTPARMMTGQPGTSCTPTEEPSGWPSYTKSVCYSMRRYVTPDGAILTSGTTPVVCQRDRGMTNRVFIKGQTNTWWFFARSDNDRWAWFPETLFKQGAADRPINGIPVCG